MSLMTPTNVDLVIRRSPWYMLICLTLFIIAYYSGFGVVTGWMALLVAACGGVFRPWRTEKGLWMLSAFYLVFSVALYGFLFHMNVEDPLAGHQEGLLIGIDFAVATGMLWMLIRFLVTVTRSNWRLSRGVGNDDLHGG